MMIHIEGVRIPAVSESNQENFIELLKLRLIPWCRRTWDYMIDRHIKLGLVALEQEVEKAQMNGRELSRRLAERQPGMKCLYVSGRAE